MREYSVAFAGHNVMIRYEGEAVASFLELLFADLKGGETERPPAGVLTISGGNEAGRPLLLTDNGQFCSRGNLSVSFAAAIFDRVIFHLLRDNDTGVALHAGAVACGQQVLLLPGQSGAGKSTLTAWLTARGFTYLTDELVFLPAAEPLQAHYFTRPFHIKPGAKEAVKTMLLARGTSCLLEDGHGMIVPHRAIRPAPRPATLAPAPSVLLFPAYRPGDTLRLEKVSRAQAGGYLMACDVNGRNLADHGFGQLMNIARSIPAYRLIYSSFEGLDEAIAPLLTANPDLP